MFGSGAAFLFGKVFVIKIHCAMDEQLQIKIFEKTYTVHFPTVDEFLQIESTKTSLAAGQYGQMVAARSRTALMALDMIDAFSTFFVLLPELQVEKVLPANINELKPNQIGQLLVAYKTQYFPWADKIMRGIEEQVKEAQKALINAEQEYAEETSK